MRIEISNDIGRTFDMLKGSGPLEAFFKKDEGKTTRFYQDRDTFIKEVAYMNKESFTCYTGIQPRIEGLNASASNEGVKALHKLYTDIDPKRPDKTNSTDAEKAGALLVARKIQTDFESRGYQRPIVADSGNGFWVLFTIPEIEINDTNRAEVAAKLKAWGQRIIDKYSSVAVKIDNVYDLKRITKVFGTRIFNKPESEGRPQRVSGFLDDHEPIPDEKLRDDFLNIPVEVVPETAKNTPEGRTPFNIDRIFERCYTLRFLKEKSEAGTNLTHSVRLALSTISLGLNDLENDMVFIKAMLQGCPDFDEKKTRYYLARNDGKGSPYGCEVLKRITEEHFNDFDSEKCNCQLPASLDKETGKQRKPSPIRFAYFLTEDLDSVWEQLERSDNSFQQYLKLQDFSREFLSQVPKDQAKAFLDSKKEDVGLKSGTITDLLKAATEEEPTKKSTQAEIILRLAEAAEVFRDYDDIAYATFSVNGHKETWPVRSKGFRRWLAHKFYEEQGKPAGGQAFSDSIAQIEARAQFEGSQKDVFTRMAFLEGRVFIDLCNNRWECVEISKTGYQVLSEPPVKFRRSRGMKALPYPVKGNMASLKAFLNVKGNSDWSLMGAWLIACFSEGPYPVLLLQGEQGTAKSTISKMLKSIIDPSSSPLRTLPREVRDLMIAASNGWIVAFDNLSGMPIWMSDSICRLATGGGFSTRMLYENDEEMIFEAMRPVILNGIDDIATRHDLVDRAIIVNLEAIPEDKRRPEKEIWAEFGEVKPQILGGILDAVSGAIRNQGRVSFDSLPRMADFALWVAAAEKENPWSEKGTFLKYYEGNRNAAIQMAIDADLVGSSIMGLMLIEEGKWQGTATELLDKLNELVPEHSRKTRSWPKQPHFLSGRLKRAATFLRGLGVKIDFPDRNKKKREYTILTDYPVKGAAECSAGAAETASAAPFSGTIKAEQFPNVIETNFKGSAGAAQKPNLSKSNNFKSFEGMTGDDTEEITVTI